MINPFTHRKILKKGKPGTATIISMSLPQSGASSQNTAMTLQVDVEGRAPHEVEDQRMVSSKDKLGFGMQLPVKVDLDRPEQVAIDWEAARRMGAAETTARRQALAAQGPVGAGGAAAAGGVGPIQDPLAGGAMVGMAGMGGMGGMGGATPQLEKLQGGACSDGPPSDGAPSKLERLARLRDSGTLTDAEFEAGKKQMLGEI